MGCGRFRRFFLSEQGLRGGWKALLFVAIYQALAMGTAPVLRRVISLKPSGPISPVLASIREFWELLLVFVTTAVMARVDQRSVFPSVTPVPQS
jgi:hypothetical protein